MLWQRMNLMRSYTFKWHWRRWPLVSSEGLEDIQSNWFSAQKRSRRRNPFYLPSGYHLKIWVRTNGIGRGERKHVSVSVYMTEGWYNARLKCPFTGEVTFTLLSQLEDKNHHSQTAVLDGRGEVLDGRHVHFDTFIHHSTLAYNPKRYTQYLKDNTLHFRLQVKETADNPWLCEGQIV